MVSPEVSTRTTTDEDGQDQQLVFRCTFCGAATHEDVVKAAFWGMRGLVAIEDITARVCGGCGEQFYSDETAHRLQQIIHGSAGIPKREMNVPVYSLADSPPSAT